MKIVRPASLIVLGLAAAALAGCSGSSGSDVPPTNVDEAIGNITEATPLNETLPSPTPTANATTAARAISPPTGGNFGTPDEQTYDDADATGMTAKLPREEPTPEATQPTEQK